MIVSCSSCDFQGDEAEANRATAILARHSLGDLFSDVECPTCFSLCYPAHPEDRYPYAQVGFDELCETILALADRPFADQDLKSLAARLPQRGYRIPDGLRRRA